MPKSAGITAEVKAQGGAATDASPTITGTDVSVYQNFAFVQASYELFEDTDIGSLLGDLATDAKMRLEATQFVTGAGTTEPWGVITRLSATTGSGVASTTGGSFTTASVVDVFKVRDATPQRSRQSPGVAWLSNIAVASIISQMATGTAAGPGGFWSNLQMDTPPLLLGKPYSEASAMDTTLSAGRYILAMVDLKQYTSVLEATATANLPLLRAHRYRLLPPRSALRSVSKDASRPVSARH